MILPDSYLIVFALGVLVGAALRAWGVTPPHRGPVRHSGRRCPVVPVTQSPARRATSGGPPHVMVRRSPYDWNREVAR